MATMGERIKELRTHMRLTEQEFGLRFNRKQSIVSKWEKNQRIPQYGIMIQMSDMSGWSLDYLTGKSDQMQKTGTAPGL